MQLGVCNKPLQANMLKLRYNEADSLVEAGVDEAGRGCFWGPLMAAAVVFPTESDWTDEIRAIAPKIRDSKKVSPKRRAELAAQIKKYAISYGVGSVSAEDLDANGVTWANQTAFERALALLSPAPNRVLIDGTLSCKFPGADVLTVIDGDATYLSIAAASILAKEAHDDWVREFCEAEPDIAARYSLASCKGYGTAKHREGLRIHGVHEYHRRRFLNGGGASAGGYKRKEAGCLIQIQDSDVLG